MQIKKCGKINGFIIFILLLNLTFLSFNTNLGQDITDPDSNTYNNLEVSVSNDENHYFISTSNLTVSISSSNGQIKYFPLNNEHNIEFMITIDRIEIFSSKMPDNYLPEPTYTSNLKKEWYFIENPDESDNDRGVDPILIMYSTCDLEKSIKDGSSTDDNNKPNEVPGSSQEKDNQPTTGEDPGKEKITNAVKLELIFKPVPLNPDEIKIDYQITFLKEIPDSVSIAMVHELKVVLEKNYEFEFQEMSRSEKKIINQDPIDNRMMNIFSNTGPKGINFITNGLETGFFTCEDEYSIANNNKTLAAGYIYKSNLFELYYIYDMVTDDNGSLYGIVHDPEIGIYSENFESLQELKEDIEKFVEEHYKSIAAGVVIGVVITSFVVVRAHTVARKNRVSVVRLENNRYYKK